MAYSSFPGLTTAANGDLVAAWREGVNHTDGPSSILVKISSDGGDTWGSAITARNDGTNDFGTAVLSTLSDGRVALVTWRRSATGQTLYTDSTEIVFSSDNGATWGAATAIESGFTEYGVSESPMVELSDGTLLIAIWGRDSGDGVTRTSVKIFASTDDGVTWGERALLADGPTDGRHWNETGLALMPDGTLLAIVREDSTSQSLWSATSTDDGATWSDLVQRVGPDVRGAPRPTVIEGKVYTAQRIGSPGPCGVLVVDGGSWEYTLGIQPEPYNFIYGQVVELDEKKLGLIRAVEPSTSSGDVYFTVLSRNEP